MFAIVICLVLIMCTVNICVVCINGRRYVCCGECYVVTDECYEPTSCLLQPIVTHCCDVTYFGCFDFRGEFAFLNCDDICTCVVNKQFELFEFVFVSVYVDLQYDDISLNSYLEEITAYLKDNSLLISAPISTVTLFSPDPHQARTHPIILIEDSQLPLVQWPNILGVYLDTSLSESRESIQ